MSPAARASTTPWRGSSPGRRSSSFRSALAVLVGFASYAISAWRMTAKQRLAGAKAIIEAPEVFTGRIPRRVRGRSPAAIAGYELPMALLGFPGIGWLFAGFSFTASVLLLAGPALTWAVIPIAFSPYGQGPAQHTRLEGRARVDPADRPPLDGPALPRAATQAPAARRHSAPNAAPPAAPGAGTAPASASRPGRSCSCSSRCRSCPRWPGWAGARSGTRTRRASRPTSSGSSSRPAAGR